MWPISRAWHHSDLRYLSDVSTGRFETVELLTNPRPSTEVWMWQGIVKDAWTPVKAHGVEIFSASLRRWHGDDESQGFVDYRRWIWPAAVRQSEDAAEAKGAVRWR